MKIRGKMRRKVNREMRRKVMRKARRKIGTLGDGRAGRREGRKKERLEGREIEIRGEVGETTVVDPAGLTFKLRVSLNDYFFSGPRFLCCPFPHACSLYSTHEQIYTNATTLLTI